MLNKTIALLGVAVVFACTAVLYAEDEGVAERFTFVAAGAPEDGLRKGAPLDLVINRWSTDEERERVMQAVAEPDTLLAAFRNVGAIGYLEWPGGLEYAVRYARRTERPDGGADIVLVAERPLWRWWDDSATWTPEPGYTVIQLRVDAKGMGVGHASFGTTITSDQQTGLALANVSGQPLLTDVRRATS